MNPLRFVVILFISHVASYQLLAQCDDSQSLSIRVPQERSDIAKALNYAQENPIYKNKKVTIKVAPGTYKAFNIASPGVSKDRQGGLLISRDCTDVIGIPASDGTKPIIAREKFGDYEQAVVEIRGSNIRFEGFDVKSSSSGNGYGILIVVSKDATEKERGFANISINNNIVRDIGNSEKDSQGIMVWNNHKIPVKNIRITNNVLKNLRLRNSEALTIKNNVDGFHILNNIISDVSNIGIDIIGFENGTDFQAKNGVISGNKISGLRFKENSAYPWIAGIYVDGGRDTLISKNEVTGYGFGIVLASEHFKGNVTDVTVNNNLVYRNLVGGISAGHSLNIDREDKKVDDQRGLVSGCIITGNLIVDNGIGITSDNSPYDNGQLQFISQLPNGLERIVVENNDVCISVGQKTSHLLYWDNSLWKDKWENKQHSCLSECCKNDHNCEGKLLEKCNKECFEHYSSMRSIPQTNNKLSVFFRNNRFHRSGYDRSWYFSGEAEFGGSSTEARSRLEKYFEEFNPSNSFENNCPDSTKFWK